MSEDRFGPQSANTEVAEETVRPTYAPAAMAMGVMMLMWGILTHWFLSLVGASLMAWSLYTWMQEIRICAEQDKQE